MRRRCSYANVTATLALVFSMSGGALAAKHYLVTSTKQFSPKVLAALKGKVGSTGSAGAQGREGPQGKEGKQGLEGKEGKPGKEGKEGPEGPGAIEFKSFVPEGGGTTLAELDGIKVTGSCNVSHEATLTIEGALSPYFLQADGTANLEGVLKPVHTNGQAGNVPEQISGSHAADLNVIARNNSPINPPWPFMRIDAAAEGNMGGGPCGFVGMVIPSGGQFG
jgi:hypothetical protein